MTHYARHIALLTGTMIAAAGVSLWLGQDANWDLQNYHFYNAYALLNGRIGWDIAPAQIQTYHNPVLDLPFYWMVRVGFPAWAIAVVLAVPAGIGLFFLCLTLLRLFSPSTRLSRFPMTVAIAIGCTGTMGISLLSSTMNEWQGAMLVMAALWLLLRDSGAPVARPAPRLLLAGLLAGMAGGLKPTAAPYAIGLLVAIVAQRMSIRSVWFQGLVFAGATAAGILAVSGAWMLKLWEAFHNPIFPYFNGIIASPWWLNVNHPERIFGPHSLKEWLLFPLRVFRSTAFYVTEVSFRDWRLPAVYLSAILAATWLCLRWFGRRQAAKRGERTLEHNAGRMDDGWRLVIVFWATSFVIWAAQYSIYRYTIPLELLSGALIVRSVQLVFPKTVFAPVALLVAAAVIVSAQYPAWGRGEFAPRYFAVEAPTLPPHAMAILVGDAPISYVIPFIAADARFVGYANNAVAVQGEHKLAHLARDAIDSHAGPIFSLALPQTNAASPLATRRLIQDRSHCGFITTNMPASPIELCPLSRMPPSMDSEMGR